MWQGKKRILWKLALMIPVWWDSCKILTKKSIKIEKKIKQSDGNQFSTLKELLLLYIIYFLKDYTEILLRDLFKKRKKVYIYLYNQWFKIFKNI